MRDKETLHRKVQELVDCFATADPLKQMSLMKGDQGEEEAPLKWLALAVLHGINAGAKEISVVRSAEGETRVFAEYRKAELPTPGEAIGKRIFESLRQITHLEGDKGKTALAMGVREGSIELGVKIKKENEGETITLKFPESYGHDRGKEKKRGKTAETASQAGGGNLDYCRFAADPEHERSYREEEPCDDARTGDYEKQVGNEKKVR